MELSDRKKKILGAIIESYIESAEPVGSRTISKSNDLKLSPATIRNEMADLEEMGYLEQPHTSAGRVPSNLGYRFYVDSLMQQYQLTVREMEQMRDAMKVRFNELDRILTYAASCVSQFTNYTTVAVAPSVSKCVIKKVEIIPVDEQSFLLVIIPSGGTAKNRLFRSERPLSADMLTMLRHFLNLTITDRIASEISMESVLSLETAMGDNRDLVMPILRFALDSISDMDADNVHMAGVQKMLQYPEYQDVEKVREFLRMVEDKKALGEFLEDSDAGQDMTIIIGDELGQGKSDDTSIIICRCHPGESNSGLIGIIGPKRMDYAKAITSLRFFTNNLSRTLNGGQPPDDDKEEQHGG